MTEEERMRTFVATTAKSADIMPETTCFQRGREKNKYLGELRIFWKVMQKRNLKQREDHLLSNFCFLQRRVNNLNVDQKKTSYARFKVKQRNIFGLALIDTGNLVHTSLVSGKFWEAIGGRINRAMDY